MEDGSVGGRGNSKFRNKMYPIARGSRVEAATIGIISIGWADFRLILVSRAPTYCNHADILCSCNARSPGPLHPPSPIPPHPPTPPSSRRSMPSSAADNSIILHAKTASDVLAQSASHLCEQITSYRKTDFIFEGRCLRYFFPAPSSSPPLLLFPSFRLVSPRNRDFFRICGRILTCEGSTWSGWRKEIFRGVKSDLVRFAWCFSNCYFLCFEL